LSPHKSPAETTNFRRDQKGPKWVAVRILRKKEANGEVLGLIKHDRLKGDRPRLPIDVACRRASKLQPGHRGPPSSAIALEVREQHLDLLAEPARGAPLTARDRSRAGRCRSARSQH
jgi:hypothetical protein